MFDNSLFRDFLIENNLIEIKNNEYTNDFVCLEYNYSTRSFKEEISHLKSVAVKARMDYKLAKSHRKDKEIQSMMQKRKKIASVYRRVIGQEHLFEKLSVDELRYMTYENGIDIEYVQHGRSGAVKLREKIHYKMLYRSTGKAKKGTCMFVNSKIYDQALHFLRMGIDLGEDGSKIVEISAYSPLVSSSIVGKIKIDPDEILVLKDVERTFKTNVISVEIDENKHCLAKELSDYTLKNTLFDGQALIESSICPEWTNGYLLLRQHFTKTAAAVTHLQKFFREYFGDEYETATVTDMFGRQVRIKDVKLVTTDNALKWLKFNVSYEYWSEWVRLNGSYFGIVKTAHESKFGNKQRMSYQMVSALSEEMMDDVVSDSVRYINRMKQDDMIFLDFLEMNKNFTNDYDVLIDLCKHNREFPRSSYFRDRKRSIIDGYVRKVRSGKLLQNAENLVIIGSPYAMLLYAATGNPESVDLDDTFAVEENTIQCYTSRFYDKEYLAFFRSPFNSRNNLTYLHNKYDERFKKYFNFGKQVVAVNMIGTDFQDRNNGSDQDSDSGYTTNQPNIVEQARLCYLNYPTIVNNIPKEKKSYNNTPHDFALVDNELSKSQRSIGESSNLALLAQTYMYTFPDRKFYDYVCILSVIAQVAIDNSKRKFDIDIVDEIRRIKKDMDVKRNGFPEFWKVIKPEFNGKNVNKSLKCPMNSLYNLRAGDFHSPIRTVPMSEFFIKHEVPANNPRKCKKVESMIERYSLNVYMERTRQDNCTDYDILWSDFENLINDIRKIYISGKYKYLFSWLIDRAAVITPSVRSNSKKISSNTNKNCPVLFKTLYTVNKEAFLSCFVEKK